MTEKTITIDLNTALIKTYGLRATGRGTTFESTIPLEPLEREARQLGIPLEQFIENYEAVWHYDGFPGLYLTFREKKTTAAAQNKVSA